MKQEELEEVRRLKDLHERGLKQGIYTFTGFLNMNQLSVFYEHVNEIGAANGKVFGGYQDAERAMIRFGNPEELGYEEEFPIVCVQFAPANEKFASEIGHRDVLGALMNLGIERTLIGDIRFVNRKIYVYCASHIADFLCSEITRIGRTVVVSEIAQPDQLLDMVQMEECTGNIASLRLDVFVAFLTDLSRKNSTELLLAKNVYVNGRICDNFSYLMKDGDVISIRGYGKFVFKGVLGQTKKERLKVHYQKYV